MRLIDIEAEVCADCVCRDKCDRQTYCFAKEMQTVNAVPVVRKPVVGYEGYYEVDQFGRVFGVDRVISVDDNGRKYKKPIAGNQMKQSLKNKGYKVVSLTKDGITKYGYVWEHDFCSYGERKEG